jgi:hypothetical protein
MRLIYVDEAGTAANEPVTVVVGLVVHADDQWRKAERAVAEVLASVPEVHRKGFVSHATQIWNDRRYREAWDVSARRDFLLTMMSLPRRLDIPVAMAMVRRNAEDVEPGKVPMRKEQFQHLIAFGSCIEQADDYIRKYGTENEVATVVAEDVPEMRSWLKKAISGMRASGGWTLKPEHQRPTQSQLDRNELPGNKWVGINRVVDVVHFIGKTEGPLLQVADACAFGFRRYFAELDFGEQCVRAILGVDLVRDDWSGGISQFTFYRKREGRSA